MQNPIKKKDAIINGIRINMRSVLLSFLLYVLSKIYHVLTFMLILISVYLNTNMDLWKFADENMMAVSPEPI